MVYDKNKSYVTRESERAVEGPFWTKREAKIVSDSLIMKKTIKSKIYPSMYHAGHDIIVATGASLELAGYGYYFENK